MEPALCDKVMAHAARCQSPHAAVILFQVAGALNTVAPDHSAAGADMRAFSTGGNYINFQTEDESADRLHAALGGGLPRLAAIKATWDPANVFRTNRNIPPAAGV